MHHVLHSQYGLVFVVMDGQTEVPMIHFECQVCHMSATVVSTPAGELAWLDHMNTHAMKDDFKAWTWTVLPLQ